MSSNPVHGERGVLDTTLCDSVCQCRWFCPGIPVSLINKTDRHDINDILLKVTGAGNCPEFEKTKDRATRTPLKTGSERMCSGRLNSSALHIKLAFLLLR